MMNPSDMMNRTGGWMGGGIVIWTVVGIVVVILLFLMISKWSKK
jgi:uncharacterized membrane protein